MCLGDLEGAISDFKKVPPRKTAKDDKTDYKSVLAHKNSKHYKNSKKLIAKTLENAPQYLKEIIVKTIANIGNINDLRSGLN